MKQFLFIVVIYLLTISCDSIYVQKSQKLEIKSDDSFSEALRIEGEMQLFPTLKSIYIDSKEKIISNTLVILFYKNEDLLECKKSILENGYKTISKIQSILDSKKSYTFIIPESKTTTFAQSLKNVSVSKNGLWIVFYTEKVSQEIGVSLEFKRLGNKEIPKTKIVKVP